MIFFSSFQSVNKRVVGLINVLFLQGSLFAISRIEILKKKKSNSTCSLIWLFFESLLSL